MQYRLARRNTKRIVKEAKENSWRKYGEHLTGLCKNNPRDFFKSINAMRMRNENYNPIAIINSRDGTPLLNGNDRKNRWKEYFQELYNPNILTQHTYKGKDQDIAEPEMLAKK